MATARRTRTAPVPEATPDTTTPPRVNVEYIPITDLAAYEWNPRQNAAAVESVANSIRTFGFLVPVVIDADNVIIAGHTRVEGAKTLHLDEVPCIRATHLTPDQVNAFRIIDNKVSELAKWDFDMLSGEISKLSDSGLTLTDYGFSREELDCLSDMVASDCLSAEGLVDAEARQRMQHAERRAPNTARFVLGELVFFIPATVYREWVMQLREDCDYDEAAITRELKQRLGIPSEQ